MRGAVDLIILALYAVRAAAFYWQLEAVEHAYLATAAYCGYPKTTRASLEAWACGPPCAHVWGMAQVRQILTPDNNDAYAFVGKLRGRCVLAFRGTSNLAGWSQDLKSAELVELQGQGVPCSYGGSPCRVGNGFMANYNSIAAFIRGNLSEIGCWPGARMTITGHSLGAAEAIIAMYDLRGQGYRIERTYTFGQPRVGDRTFAAAFDRDVGRGTAFRVTYHRDPVVHLPLENEARGGFTHTATEVFYDGPVCKGHIVCNGSGEDRRCSDRYTDLFQMVKSCLQDVNACDHLHYMTPAKMSLMDGSSCMSGASAEVLV